MIDVSHFLSLAFADWLRSRNATDDTLAVGDAKLLLIDDSDFFRNMLKPVLTVAGYEVKAVSSAKAALKLMDEGNMYDLIISDIEMPEMNGFDFAKSIKGGSRWENVPLVALSALATERDINRGHDAGFDDYIAKFDKETLLRSLAQQLKIRGDAA